MVNGVLASCYASFDHDVAHIAMTPVQWFSDVIQLVFGENVNISSYVMIAKEIGRWVLDHGDLMYN